MRRLILVAIITLTLLLLVTNLDEVQRVATTLLGGNLIWVGLAIVVQLAWLVTVAALFRAIYGLLGIDEKIERLAPLAAAANFVNVVTPTFGLGGLSLLIVDGRRRGRPAGRVTTAIALYFLYDYLAFFFILVLGLIVFVRRELLGPAELAPSIVFVLGTSFIGSIVLLGLRSPHRLGILLAKIGDLVNRVLQPVLHRDYLNVSQVHLFAAEIADGLTSARKSPGWLILPLALALTTKLLLMSILTLLFMAFNQPFSVGTIIGGFSIGYVLLVVSPTPAGIGFVEGGMTIGLSSLGVPFATAAVITLAYRGITFWLPLAYGFLSFRWINRDLKVSSDQSGA